MYIGAVPVEDESAETIPKIKFDRWITIFGTSLRIQSDQETSFVSVIVKHVSAKIGTTRIETSPYHPETDGCVERWNRTMSQDLRRHIPANCHGLRIRALSHFDTTQV